MMTFGSGAETSSSEDFGVFGSRLSEVFSDEHFGSGRREGKKMCRRREEKGNNRG